MRSLYSVVQAQRCNFWYDTTVTFYLYDAFIQTKLFSDSPYEVSKAYFPISLLWTRRPTEAKSTWETQADLQGRPHPLACRRPVWRSWDFHLHFRNACFKQKFKHKPVSSRKEEKHHLLNVYARPVTFMCCHLGLHTTTLYFLTRKAFAQGCTASSYHPSTRSSVGYSEFSAAISATRPTTFCKKWLLILFLRLPPFQLWWCNKSESVCIRQAPSCSSQQCGCVSVLVSKSA